MFPLLAGLAVSLVAALFLSRLLGAILYEIQGNDPVTYAGAAAVLLAVGAAASARPAWKAAAGDPLPRCVGIAATALPPSGSGKA